MGDSVEDVTSRCVSVSKRMTSVLWASSVILYSHNAPDKEQKHMIGIKVNCIQKINRLLSQIKAVVIGLLTCVRLRLPVSPYIFL